MTASQKSVLIKGYVLMSFFFFCLFVFDFLFLLELYMIVFCYFFIPLF